MEYQIVDNDTGNTYNISVIVEDSEVAEIWGKWKPIEDEESTEIEIQDYWDIKQLVGAELRKNKVKILENVYLSHYEKYSILYNRSTGKVYHFNNHNFVLEIKGPSELELRRISTNSRRCVYKDGEFYPTKRTWLIKGSQELSKKKCSGIKFCSDLYGEIDIKDHQITSAMFLGQEAIELTMCEFAEDTINHRNLDNDDQRLENLEMVSIDQNNKHYRVLEEFRNKKLALTLKELGITNYSIMKKLNG